MGTENKSVVARNWRSGERLTTKGYEGIWGYEGTVLYLECNDFTQLCAIFKTHSTAHAQR